MRVLLIPAAGRGSRLGAEGPKALHPVHGRPMLDWLFDLYRPCVDAFVLVVRPEHEARIHRHATAAADRACHLALQAEPTGMLDAILAPHDLITAMAPEWVWITWCDQVAISPATVARLRAACDRAGADLILPTARRAHPYVHLRRDATGSIDRVLSAREGDPMPPTGEQDAGLFALHGACYGSHLPRFAAGATAAGARGERNFLPFIPHVAASGRVESFPVAGIESVGVNDAADLRQVEEHLRGRP